MRVLLIGIVAMVFSNLSFAQLIIPNGGFTNKAEAKNQTVSGEKEGKWVEYDTTYDVNANGDSVLELGAYTLTIYKSGTPDGMVRTYDKTGKLLSETPYKNGRENGIEKKYFDNGKPEYEIPYTNGKRDGLEKHYKENGTLESETSYKNGKAGDVITYDENGKEIK